MVKGLRRSTVLALTAWLAIGCGGSGAHRVAARATGTPTSTPTPRPKPAAKPPSDEDQLKGLMADRARDLSSGDAAAMAKTSTGAQVRRDARAGRSAASLGLGSVFMDQTATEVSGAHATLRVTTEYTFDELPDSTFESRSLVKAVKTDAGWRVRSTSPTGVQPPWELGRYTARNSKHFFAIAPRGLKVGALMSDLEAGRKRMQRALPSSVRAPSRLLVLVTRGTTDARALTKDIRAMGSLTAMAEANVDLRGPAQRVAHLGSQRLLVVWPSFSRFDGDGRRMVIAHELTHAALARRTSGRTPVWLLEGAALYASGDKRYTDAGRLLSGDRFVNAAAQKASLPTLSLTALARPTSMLHLTATPLAVAYSYSAAAAFAIAAHYGRAGLLRLYNAFNNPKIRGRAGPKLEAAVIRHTFHRSLKSLQDEIDAFARAHA
jgi:hypothetical protein